MFSACLSPGTGTQVASASSHSATNNQAWLALSGRAAHVWRPPRGARHVRRREHGAAVGGDEHLLRPGEQLVKVGVAPAKALHDCGEKFIRDCVWWVSPANLATSAAAAQRPTASSTSRSWLPVVLSPRRG